MFCSTLLRAKRYGLARSYLHGTGARTCMHVLLGCVWVLCLCGQCSPCPWGCVHIFLW